MLTIIGCGNANRTDDAVGVVVAGLLHRHLLQQPCANIQVHDAGTDGMSVMFRARGSTSLIIVDACQTGAEAGAIFEVPGSELEGEPPGSFNLHDFRWDHALYAGRQIYKDEFPDDVTVYLIEAQSLALGLDLTPAVLAAAKTVVSKIKHQMAVYDAARNQ